MSWNNVVPAWALLPVRVIGYYSDGKRFQRGFKTKEEADSFIHNERDHLIVEKFLVDEES
jgi:hypothetical protein